VTEGLALVDVAKQPLDVARLLYVRASRTATRASSSRRRSVRERARHRRALRDPRSSPARTRAVALGTTYRRLGRTTKAIASYEIALATASRANELKLAAQGFMGIAVSHYDAGDLDAAIASYERALELFERVADTSFELHVRQSLASIHFQQGHVAQARELADRTIARATEVGDEHGGAIAQVVRARVLLSDGDTAGAKRMAKQAERALGAVGDQIQRAHALRVVRSHARRVARPPMRIARSSRPSICFRPSMTAPTCRSRRRNTRRSFGLAARSTKRSRCWSSRRPGAS